MSRVLALWAGMTGTVLDFAGSTAPTGWLLCYGQAVSRTDYAPLFAAIGTTYGAGDGSTTFNLPDCRGRVHAGKDDMGGTAAARLTTAGSGVSGATLGAAGGEETHLLTTAQMPAHSHGVTDPGHTHVGQFRMGDTTTGTSWPMQGVSDNSTFEFTTASSATGVTVQSQGGSTAHNNAQPTLVLNKIIKT
jgi:microcystin-dependent protein